MPWPVFELELEDFVALEDGGQPKEDAVDADDDDDDECGGNGGGGC